MSGRVAVSPENSPKKNENAEEPQKPRKKLATKFFQIGLDDSTQGDNVEKSSTGTSHRTPQFDSSNELKLKRMEAMVEKLTSSMPEMPTPPTGLVTSGKKGKKYIFKKPPASASKKDDKKPEKQNPLGPGASRGNTNTSMDMGKIYHRGVDATDDDPKRVTGMRNRLFMKASADPFGIHGDQHPDDNAEDMEHHTPEDGTGPADGGDPPPDDDGDGDGGDGPPGDGNYEGYGDGSNDGEEEMNFDFFDNGLPPANPPGNDPPGPPGFDPDDDPEEEEEDDDEEGARELFERAMVQYNRHQEAMMALLHQILDVHRNMLNELRTRGNVGANAGGQNGGMSIMDIYKKYNTKKRLTTMYGETPRGYFKEIRAFKRHIKGTSVDEKLVVLEAMIKEGSCADKAFQRVLDAWDDDAVNTEDEKMRFLDAVLAEIASDAGFDLERNQSELQQYYVDDLEEVVFVAFSNVQHAISVFKSKYMSARKDVQGFVPYLHDTNDSYETNVSADREKDRILSLLPAKIADKVKDRMANLPARRRSIDTLFK